MRWKQIKEEILLRHEHAVALDDDEVRVVFGYRGGQRVPVVVRHHDGGVVSVIAQVAIGTTTQIIAMLRAATAFGIPLALLGDSVCVRSVITSAEVEHVLQSTARAALRLRSATLPPRTDLGAFSFAL